MTQPMAEKPSTPLFGGIEQAEWPQLLGNATQVELGANEPVFLQGETADAVFVLVRGGAEVRIRNGEQEAVLGRAEDGALLGETSLLLGGQHSASVFTTKPSVLLRFPREALLSALNDGQRGAMKLLFNIARTLALRLRAADAHIGEMAKDDNRAATVNNDLDRLRNIFFTEWA